MRLPIAGPSITELEIEYVTDAVRNDWYHKAGNYLGRFEQAFAKHTGRHFAISLPSCTSALHLALAAAGVGFDDEVVVPDCTWIASAAPISYVGAKPVFVDIDPSNLVSFSGSFGISNNAQDSSGYSSRSLRTDARLGCDSRNMRSAWFDCH